MTVKCFVTTPETRRVRDRLARLEKGEIVSWDELSSLVGEDARAGNPGYGHVYSARNMLERAGTMAFLAVENVGVKRATDVELIALGATYRRKTCNASRRGRRKMLVLGDGFRGLSNEDRLRYCATLALLANAEQQSDTHAQRRAERGLAEALPPLPIDQYREV